MNKFNKKNCACHFSRKEKEMIYRWGRGREKEVLQSAKNPPTGWQVGANLARQILACRQCKIRVDMKIGIQIKNICSVNIVNLDNVTIRGR